MTYRQQMLKQTCESALKALELGDSAVITALCNSLISRAVEALSEAARQKNPRPQA